MTPKATWIASVLAAAVVAFGFAGPARAVQGGKSPVQVFIMAGQSNMEGHGEIKPRPGSANGGKGSLQYLVKDPATAAQYRHIIDASGNWVVRNDVWIWYLGRKGGLTTGYGANGGLIGPEFQFGHVVGGAIDNQVLIIKTAWGGKSIQKDFRPPSSGGEVGPYYKEMIQHIKDVLGNLRANFPDYDGGGFQLAGFGWHQGWNDGCSGEATAEYEKNMINFIRDVRKEVKVKDLPFVIASSGFGGQGCSGRRLDLCKAQAAAAKAVSMAVCVDTRDFFRPPDASPSSQGYHWNRNAETYFLIGDAMGKTMLKLMKARLAKAKPAAKPAPAGKTKPEDKGWDFLFEYDLSNASYPKGVWSYKGSVLTATQDKNIWTRKLYTDFILDLEFKTAPGTNSGVIVHCSDANNWIPNSVEVQIADDFAERWAKADKTWQCAAIFGHLAPTKSMVKKPGEWNRMTVTCKGKIIRVSLNGEEVTVMDMSKWTSAKKNPNGSDIPRWLSKPKAELPLKGRIGFQGKHAGAPIYFRNIKIKELR